ncbi:MAG TPA: hypothetical protein VF384_17865 [Planctomycetota bacterium]
MDVLVLIWRSLLAAVVACAAPIGAQRALLDRLPPDADVAAHSWVGFGSELDPWTLPGDGMVFGFAKIGGRMWIARGSKLHCVEWPSRRHVRTIDAPPDLVGLCADERFVYGIAGTELHVLDPIAGASMRTVKLASPWPPAAICTHGGVLHVLVDLTVLTVDPSTGAVAELCKFPARPHWIASDGTRLWYGDGLQCRPFRGDAPPRAWQGRDWPWPLHESAASWVDGRLLVALERRDDRNRPIHDAGLLTPIPDLASPRLRLDIGTFESKLCYRLGDVMVADEQALAAELRARAHERTARVRSPNGEWVRMPVILEVEPGVKVRDVARVWDVVIAAGIDTVHCPPLENWVRQQQAQKAPAEPAKKQ